MELLIIALLVPLLVSPAVMTKWVQDNRTDRAYAEKGMVSPRYQERLAKLEAAGRTNTRSVAKERGPLRNYLGELYADAIDDLQAKHRSKREHRGPAVYDPDRPSLAQRFDTAVIDAVDRVKRSKGWDTTKEAAKAAGRRFVAPVGEKPAPVNEAAEAKPEPVEAVPDDTPPADAVEPVAETDDDNAADGEPTTQTPATTGGTMTAPTGEAVNYETTIAELEALAKVQQEHVDRCSAAVVAAEQMKAAVDGMQDSYRSSSAAAQSMAEHLAAKNLDTTTLANAGTVVDAMPAGVVDRWFDQIEGIEEAAKVRLASAEAALAATVANLQHVQATYSAAHETVAGQLSGDSSFLDSGGGGAAPAPAAGSAERREPVGV